MIFISRKRYFRLLDRIERLEEKAEFLHAIGHVGCSRDNRQVPLRDAVFAITRHLELSIEVESGRPASAVIKELNK
jgi:hypothetical protein